MERGYTTPQTAPNSIKHILSNEYTAILRNNLILKYIKDNPHCTPYQVSGELDINYATVSKVIKDLSYVNLISIKVKIGSNNRTHKECFVPLTPDKNEKAPDVNLGGKPKKDAGVDILSPALSNEELNCGEKQNEECT